LQKIHVFPQYHVKFDNHFQIAQDILVKGKWKEKCHFQNPVTNRNNQLDMIQTHSPNTNAPSPDILDIPMESNTVTPSQTDTPAIIDAAVRTRAGRTVKPTSRYIESQQQRANNIVAYNTAIQDPALYSEIDRFKDLDHPITYVLKATNDPDTLYLHEALKAKDSEEFKRAMVHEVQQHTNRKHWEPIEKKDLPPNTIILPAVWAMKRKRRIDSREVYKWKSRLNIGGHKMRAGIHFDNTFSPVVSWQSVRLLLIIATVKDGQLNKLILSWPTLRQTLINQLTWNFLQESTFQT
jgi:Reverse transcriptase (RNA-dependent DNA polymerase)